MKENAILSKIPRGSPSRVLSLAFGRAYAITMRPYLLFVSGIAGVAGMALAPAIGLSPTLLLATVFFLSYGFGQALTDCFQLDTDRLSSPYRPLVRGTIRRRDVLVVSLAGLVTGGLILVCSHPMNLPLAILAVGGLATYTYFKRRWWGGPFYNAWIVALLPLMGFAAVSGIAGSKLTWPAALSWVAVATFFGYANFVLTGYFKDISADRATGYHTFPVVFGPRRSAWVSDGLAVLAVTAAVIAVLETTNDSLSLMQHGVALAFLLAGGGASLIAQLRLHRIQEETRAHLAIAPVVHAFLLLLSAPATAYRPEFAAPLIVLYLAFLWVLRRRPVRDQI